MSQAAQTARAAATRTDLPPAAPHQSPPYRWALGTGLGVFALYAFTVGPTTAFWDTSEYIATSHILGIPHPPGNPLFVLLARAWSLLLSPLEPLGLTVAVRVNLFSSFMSAGAAFFWFLVLHRILGYFTEQPWVRRAGAIAGVVVGATAFTVWHQSNVNEKVYTVSLFAIAALSWLAFLWRDHVEEHRGQVNRRWHDDNAILLMVFILALSVGNHLMAFLAAPALILFLLWVKPTIFLNWRLYPLAVAFGIIGLSVHMYLPLRAGLDPIINEAEPTCETVGGALTSVLTFGNAGCENLSASLQREQYAKPPLTERQAPIGAQVLNYVQYFDWQWSRSIQGTHGYLAPLRIPFTLLFLGLGFFGAMEHYRRDRKSFMYIGVLLFTLSAGLTYYMNFKYGYTQAPAMGLSPQLSEVRERDYFFIGSFSMWGIWVGVGLTALWLRFAETFGGVTRRNLMRGSPVLAIALLPLVLNWDYASRRGDFAARDWAHNVLQSVEPYGVLFTNGDNDTFPLWYLQEVEGIRRDVTVIVLSYLNTPWYARQLRDLTQPCPEPNAAAADPTRIICQRAYETEPLPGFYGTPTPPTRTILPLTDAEISQATAWPGGYTRLPADVVFEARGVQAVLPANKVLTPADRFLLQIVRSAWGDRPIFFASTTNVMYELDLWRHVTRTGFGFRLTAPDETEGLLRMPTGENFSPLLGSYMDVERHRALLDQVFSYRAMGAERRNWPDDATRNIPMHYAYAFFAMAGAEQLLGRGEAAEAYAARGEEFQALAERR
jgi:hypothetical protein